jgi:FMN phosphatase YigB (HAD superfamily)
MRFKAIFFDFGGTLFSYADFLGSLKWLFLTIPLRLRVLIRPRMLKQGWLDASQEVYAEFTRSRAFYMHCDLYRAIFSDFAKRIGGNPTPEFLDWCLAKQKNIICKKFVLRKDCLSVLQKLSETMGSNSDSEWIV